MAINVNNAEADALTRKFAGIAGVGITDAIVIAMREAIQRRYSEEAPRETAVRVLGENGVTLNAKASEPLPRQVFDEMWDED